MGRLPEPDGVDIFVDSSETDPETIRETIEFIRAYKQRPGYADEIRDANQILESLPIKSTDHGMTDPDALLEHWKKCVEDLARVDPDGRANGQLH